MSKQHTEVETIACILDMMPFKHIYTTKIVNLAQ